MKEPKYRRPLNALQRDTLLVLYKFRFASVELIDEYLGKSGSKYSYVRLAGLVDQKYIGRQYSGEDKIYNRQAVYYLLPDGMQVLKTMPDLNQKALANTYNDRTRSHSFMESSLAIFRLYNSFRRLYGPSLQFYSKTEMSEYPFFPKNLPDGYITINNQPYLLEWLPASTTYPAMRGRLSQLIDHFESETWNKSGLNYPTILFVCDNPYLERQVQRIAKRSVYKAEEVDFDDMPMRTTTIKALVSSESKDELIWSDVEDQEDPIALI